MAVGILIVLVAMRHWSTSLKIVFVLVLIEGALRKWVIPGSADLVYFVKDVLLVGVYVGFWGFGPGNKNQKLLPDWLPDSEFRLALIPIVLLTFHPNIGSPLAALLGIRGYLFYIPIVLVMPYIFRDRASMIRQVAIYVMLAIPICLLGVIQFKSDGFSVINTYASGTAEWGASTFGGSEGQVRVTGTFSYLSGHVVFVCIFISLAVTLVSNPATPYRNVIAFGAIPLLAGNVFMSGSRAAVLASGLIVTGLLANRMGAKTSVGRWRATKSLLILALGIVVIGGTMFGDAIDAMQGRNNRVSDSLLVRIVEMPIDHISEAWKNGGLLGCGVGTTNPAVRALRNRFSIPDIEHHPGYYDLELGQVFAEVGLVGFTAWYAFRFMILLSLWRSYRHCQDEQLRAFILATFFVCVPFMLMSLVLNHVACVLVWGMVGLSMSALRFSRSRQQINVRVKTSTVRMKVA